MGIYINKGNEAFRIARNGEYVDKSGLISVINSTLETERCFTCVIRSRRFGKSMAARMLCAYYDESCDSHALFADLRIAKHESFERHINSLPVIFLDITNFTTKYGKDPEIVSHIQQSIIAELQSHCPELKIAKGDDLMDALIKLHAITGRKFMMIIDEWDAILREFEGDEAVVDI